MKRRSFFGAVAAVLIAPFVARASQRKAPQIHASVFESVDMRGLMRMVARSNFHDPIVFERAE